MFRKKAHGKYDEAMASGDVQTQRLHCINRQLAEETPIQYPLSPATKRRVDRALQHHLVNCEGLPAT